ncbi:MAG: glycine cleavage system aminomethyltransferase GcvT [Candidatus Geothermarchaeales archaeon]
MKKTPFYPYHESHGRIIEFVGFQMPVFYSSIIKEHMAVRNRVGLFDVSHMGRVLVGGSEAESFLNYVTTNDVSQLNVGRCHYSMLCNERGGVIDDIVVSKVDENLFLMVYNASNRGRDVPWMRRHLGGFDASLEDISDSTVMVAIQGPRAERALREDYHIVSSLGRWHNAEISIGGQRAWISRTGYTGEDGFEISLWVEGAPKDFPLDFWRHLIGLVEGEGGLPCGLGARDTLRLEAGLCLYGSDLTEDITPLEANYSWLVKFDKGDFIGRGPLERQKEGLERLRTGLIMVDPGIPRHDYKVYDGAGVEIGFVSSGTYSPILRRGVGFVYVKAEHAKPGEAVLINLRGRMARAELTGFPLYDPEEYGWRRVKT